jgi:hypothetical protein
MPARAAKSIKHHSLPEFGVGVAGQATSQITEEIHIQLHRLFHYALMINGFTTPSTAPFKSLFVLYRTHRAE